jgi:hypothetical protein
VSADLDCFYALMARLAALPNQGRVIADYTGRSGWPARGVYFFREPGELRSTDEKIQRIVRVGTHAVSANSKSTLWGRLRAHRGGRDGGGNHRGSIFRQHVGAALLAVDGQQLVTWGNRQAASRQVREREDPHERRVSDYIGRLSVLWVSVPDAPGVASDRALIERNAIALLSNQMRPVDGPSRRWLGCASQREEIRNCGLWNLDYTELTCDTRFLLVLESHIAAMSHRL